MPMEHEKYEALMNELNNPDLEHARRTDILQELRADYTSVHTDFETLTKTNEDFKKKNDDLVHANSKLFRQAGFLDREDREKQQEEEQKSFSETVTLSDLVKD